MKNKGFSVVEMVIVITIIGILAGLGTVQMLRTEAVARDKERADDVAAISLMFQDVYDDGNIDGKVVDSGDASITTSVVMGYPSTSLLNSSDSQTNTVMQSFRLDALKSPYIMSNATTPNLSLVPATSNTDLNNTTMTAGGVTLGKSNDVYVYQPLDSAGTLCQFATGNVTTGVGGSVNQKALAPRLIDNCVKYNIYYFSEAQNAIIKVKSQKSSSDGLY
ncbi:MAG: type II secretion system protein [Candidatus Saccharibacteria bacterium]|nr:type II secretion system protein [Candidatus Saccharibacteria bacterium]